jgi:hypothetical protein
LHWDGSTVAWKKRCFCRCRTSERYHSSIPAALGLWATIASSYRRYVYLLRLITIIDVNAGNSGCQSNRFGPPIQNSWQRKIFEQDRRGLPLSLPAPSLHIVQKVKERSLRSSVIKDLGLAFRSGDLSRASGSPV